MGLFEFVTEELAKKDEAAAITEPLWRDMALVWKRSWKRWRRLREDDRRRLGDTPNVRPVMLNGWVQSFAIDRFSGRENEGIVVCDAIPRVFAFYIKDKVLMRFNGLNRGHVVHCDANCSQLKQSYFAQEPIAKINNDATRLTVGYTLNAARTDMEGIEISLQVGNDPVYHFEIDGQKKYVIPMPTSESAPAPDKPGNVMMRKKNPR